MIDMAEAANSLHFDSETHTIFGSPNGPVLKPLDETLQRCPWCDYPAWDVKNMKAGDQLACLCPMCVASFNLRCIGPNEIEMEKGERHYGLTRVPGQRLSTLLDKMKQDGFMGIGHLWAKDIHVSTMVGEEQAP